MITVIMEERKIRKITRERSVRE